MCVGGWELLLYFYVLFNLMLVYEFPFTFYVYVCIFLCLKNYYKILIKKNCLNLMSKAFLILFFCATKKKIGTSIDAIIIFCNKCQRKIIYEVNKT